ncbi:MAG: SH3 domain-containing protein [Bacteroidetes bacterium]|nr:SH3 domain-containing protein [Bacteroidota bacterium]
MSLKRVSLLQFLILVPAFLFGQNSFSDSYKPGDKLYVYSRDGLSLREQADPKGKLISVLAYGTEVIVQADSKPKVSFNNSNIPGAWVKVKSGNATGYMFNGFLTRFKAMPLTTPEKSSEEFRSFLIKEFKLSKETKTSPDKIYVEFNKLDLANGVTHEYRLYEGGTSTLTSFPSKSFTMQEVFLLSKIAYPEFFTQKNCDFKADHIECSLDDMTSLDIKKEGSFIVLTFGAAD